MRKNIVHGTNNGIQAGTVHGNIRMSGGRVEIQGTVEDDDNNTSDAVNIVYGTHNGIQVGTVIGDITFG